ncbi:hypothetical protein DPMN_032255 [Dreissena polymorpha]|uniref:Uncharacterized protein n=1 Tax=Dreissena polymorpha TaxID=45954 RepID=A0A9D4M676_DREPO|nr:hypothetical protein DPMN_032255 [Dreissena polymorpha]
MEAITNQNKQGFVVPVFTGRKGESFSISYVLGQLEGINYYLKRTFHLAELEHIRNRYIQLLEFINTFTTSQNMPLLSDLGCNALNSSLQNPSEDQTLHDEHHSISDRSCVGTEDVSIKKHVSVEQTAVSPVLNQRRDSIIFKDNMEPMKLQLQLAIPQKLYAHQVRDDDPSKPQHVNSSPRRVGEVFCGDFSLIINGSTSQQCHGMSVNP